MKTIIILLLCFPLLCAAVETNVVFVATNQNPAVDQGISSISASSFKLEGNWLIKSFELPQPETLRSGKWIEFKSHIFSDGIYEEDSGDGSGFHRKIGRYKSDGKILITDFGSFSNTYEIVSTSEGFRMREIVDDETNLAAEAKPFFEAGLQKLEYSDLWIRLGQEATTTNMLQTAKQRNVGGDIGDCFKRDRTDKTLGSILRVEPGKGELVEFLNQVMNGQYVLAHSDRGYPEETYDAVLVLYDPSNKIPPLGGNLNDYELGLCTLAVANKANIVVIDMRKFPKAEDRKLIRDTIVAKLGGKVSLRKDRDGKPLDLRALLEERQLNTIGLLALDPAKPKDLTPIHGLDAEYSDKVEGLMDEALAKYNQWLKEDAIRKSKEKAEK